MARAKQSVYSVTVAGLNTYTVIARSLAEASILAEKQARKDAVIGGSVPTNASLLADGDNIVWGT